MKVSSILLVVLCIVLASCKGDSKTDPKPELDLEGNWLVDHGFNDQCEIVATFTDTDLIFTFDSLVEGACEPELFGLEGDAVTLTINHRDDYFGENDAVTAEMSVSSSAYNASAELRLWETSEGVSGVIVEAEDPNGYVQYLLDRTYLLTRPEDQ